ncbi:MAG: co-chaperone GroES [Planctomycetaceae bacterium]|nr:co-chaperone GroES [Planctomycetota bacterium]NUN51851.1 co-chaperone GroES [Planctomycetaceae bacterium]
MASKTKTGAKVRPLGDKVLIRRLEAQERTKGGIVIPDTAKEKPKEGRVVALGTGRVLDDGTTVPFQVKTGDRVLFSSYSGTDVKLEGEDFIIMGEDDVLAILE